MRRFALITVLIALLGTSVAYALETNTYSGVASYPKPFEATFTTYRSGNIIAHATFVPKGSLYVLAIFDANDNYVCHAVLDARWGRATVGDLTCNSVAWDGQTPPAGTYYVQFYPINGKVNVSIDVTAETNP